MIPMKKYIYLLFALLLLWACGSNKKTQNKSVGLKGFYAFYNTLFNGKEALNTEINNRKKEYKDNFYAPYIPLITTDEEIAAEGDLDTPSLSFSTDFPEENLSNNTNQNLSVLQIAEAKALKTINKYSVVKDGEEKNKKIFDASLLLAQSRLMMNKPLPALDALNYIFTHLKKNKNLPLAKIYQAQAYTKLKNYSKAEQIFEEAKTNAQLKKSHAKLLSVYYAQMLINANKKEQAVEELSEAYTLNKNRVLRSRISFLRGQILNELGRKTEARESFITAYKYANNFEFEVKSQIEIAKTFTENDNYEEAKKYIENISKKGIYISRKNEFYYALGLIANKAGKTEEADQYFKKALQENASDGQIRGLTFYEIGKKHFQNNDYIATAAYYDSALAVMTYTPVKDSLQELSKNIKKITTNYYLIKKNDSILALTQMTQPEREAYFGKIIKDLKEKEEKEELELRRAERSKGFDNADYNANSIFRGNTSNFKDFSSSKGGFYFANASTVSKGTNEFKQIWGNRALADNWRFSNKINSIQDTKNEAMGIQSVKDPRRFEVAFYIEKIPTDKEELLQLKKDRDTASLGLGIMYQNYFSKTELATKTLYDLVDNNPEEEVKLQALYQIFSMNYEENPQRAERAKSLILKDFPYTSYAEFVKNPKNTKFSASSEEVENKYQEAYQLYTEEKYEDSKQIIDSVLSQYPKDALVPKFSLLNAFNTGKTAGKEVMILQLEQLALNYSKTFEGEKAKEMLNYLKSELKVEHTDEKGQKINPQSENPRPSQREEREKLANPFTMPNTNNRDKKVNERKNNKPRVNVSQGDADMVD